MIFFKTTFFAAIKRFFSLVWDFVMPARCAVCGMVVDGKDVVCEKCLSQVMYTDFAALPFNPMEQKLHRLTGQNTPAMALCVYTHDGLAGRVVDAFKYHHRRDMALWAGEMIGRELSMAKRWEGYDYVVPIPLHPSREKERGYNQALQICMGIAACYDVEICDGPDKGCCLLQPSDARRIPLFHNRTALRTAACRTRLCGDSLRTVLYCGCRSYIV